MPAANPYNAPAAAVEADQATCTACGAALPVTVAACPSCGARQRRWVSKSALLLLTFFLGGLGAHKFYLGQWVQGIFFLLFFLTGIPALVALIEFVIYAFSSSERLNRGYSARFPPIPVALCVATFMVVVVGGLAAITIPAYLDYNMRTAMSETTFEMSDAKSAVGDYYDANRTLPVTGTEVKMPAPAAPGPDGREHYAGSIHIGRGGVVVGVLGRASYKEFIGQTIVMLPRAAGDHLDWDCGVQSEALVRFAHPACRKVLLPPP